MSSLNLRHCSHISAQDVACLPSNLDSLWIGPSFASSLSEIVQKIPENLIRLDLDLTQMQMNEEDVMGTLFQRLRSLQMLSLRCPGDAGAIAIAKALPYNVHLTSLDLRSNRISDQGVEAIVAALQSCRPNHSLKELILSWNSITDRGASKVASLLQDKNCPLERLDLSCNDRIYDTGLRTVVEALKCNSCLRELNVFGCDGITTVGASLLLQCLQEHNMVLQLVRLPSSLLGSPVGEELEYYLALNRAGRRLLRDHSVPVALWSDVMALSTNRTRTSSLSSKLSALYYILKQKSDLLGA